MAYVLRRPMFTSKGILLKRGDLVPEGEKPPSTAVEVKDEKAPAAEAPPKKSATSVTKAKDA